MGNSPMYYKHEFKSVEKLSDNQVKIESSNGDIYLGDDFKHCNHDYDYEGINRYGELKTKYGIYKGRVMLRHKYGNKLDHLYGATFIKWCHSRGCRATMSLNNGYTYEGRWENDKFTGYRKIEFTNGNAYEGWIKNDLKHGKGTMYYKEYNTFDGVECHGMWKDDKKHGRFITIMKDGKKYLQSWYEDVLMTNIIMDKEAKGEMNDMNIIMDKKAEGEMNDMNIIMDKKVEGEMNDVIIIQ